MEIFLHFKTEVGQTEIEPCDRSRVSHVVWTFCQYLSQQFTPTEKSLFVLAIQSLLDSCLSSKPAFKMSFNLCNISVDQKQNQGPYIKEIIKDGVQFNCFQVFLFIRNIVVSLLN